VKGKGARASWRNTRSDGHLKSGLQKQYRLKLKKAGGNGWYANTEPALEGVGFTWATMPTMGKNRKA